MRCRVGSTCSFPLPFKRRNYSFRSTGRSCYLIFYAQRYNHPPFFLVFWNQEAGAPFRIIQDISLMSGFFWDSLNLIYGNKRVKQVSCIHTAEAEMPTITHSINWSRVRVCLSLCVCLFVCLFVCFCVESAIFPSRYPYLFTSLSIHVTTLVTRRPVRSAT